VLWVENQSLVEISQRAIELSFKKITRGAHHASLRIFLHEFRIDPQCLGYIGAGTLEIALLAVRDPAQGVGLAVFRIEPEALVEIFYSAAIIVLRTIGRAP